MQHAGVELHLKGGVWLASLCVLCALAATHTRPRGSGLLRRLLIVLLDRQLCVDASFTAVVACMYVAIFLVTSVQLTQDQFGGFINYLLACLPSIRVPGRSCQGRPSMILSHPSWTMTDPPMFTR